MAKPNSPMMTSNPTTRGGYPLRTGATVQRNTVSTDREDEGTSGDQPPEPVSSWMLASPVVGGTGGAFHLSSSEFLEPVPDGTWVPSQVVTTICGQPAES